MQVLFSNSLPLRSLSFDNQRLGEVFCQKMGEYSRPIFVMVAAFHCRLSATAFEDRPILTLALAMFKLCQKHKNASSSHSLEPGNLKVRDSLRGLQDARLLLAFVVTACIRLLMSILPLGCMFSS
jgi:hypothetical protein